MKTLVWWVNQYVNDVTVLSIVALFIAVAAIFFGSW